MRSIVLFIALVSISASHAQHCPWDLSSIMIVDVRESKTGKTINGLKITVTDSKGNPYENESYGENGINELVFTQNMDKIIQKRSSFNQFPLCNGCYILIVSRKGELYDKFIMIKDTTIKKKQHFETKIVKIKPENTQSLCRESPIWSSNDFINKMKINVLLKKKGLP